MEEKYYEILRHYVNPNDCAIVVKQLLSLHNVVGQSEQLECESYYANNLSKKKECLSCGKLLKEH
tara:strand:+ start:235 stop:429 length:195 start_codon:yes stop_codon:yes gene_type:complete